MKKLAIVFSIIGLLSTPAFADATLDKAHDIIHEKDCKEIIEHHCASVKNDEKKAEACLMAWHKDHAGKHDADEAEMNAHGKCMKLIAALEHEHDHDHHHHG